MRTDRGSSQRRFIFSPEGKEAWIKAYNTIQTQEGQDGEYAEIRDASSKAAENIARIAALFHIFEDGPKGSISAENVRRSESIVRWHLDEYRRFFVDVALTPAERDAAKLDEWLTSEARTRGKNCVSRSEAYRAAFNNRNRPRFEAALKSLIGLGRARERKNGAKKIIEVRPDLVGRQ